MHNNVIHFIRLHQNCPLAYRNAFRAYLGVVVLHVHYMLRWSKSKWVLATKCNKSVESWWNTLLLLINILLEHFKNCLIKLMLQGCRKLCNYLSTVSIYHTRKFNGISSTLYSIQDALCLMHWNSRGRIRRQCNLCAINFVHGIPVAAKHAKKWSSNQTIFKNVHFSPKRTIVIVLLQWKIYKILPSWNGKNMINSLAVKIYSIYTKLFLDIMSWENILMHFYKNAEIAWMWKVKNVFLWIM